MAESARLDLTAVPRQPGVRGGAAAEFPAKTTTAARCTMIRFSRPGWCSMPGSRCSPSPPLRTRRRDARRARARIEYEPLPAILDIRAALAAQSYVLPSEHVSARPTAGVPRAAPQRLAGTVHIGGQDHFYLEGQIAIAVPQEDGGMLIHSSTQHPSEVQQIVANALGKRAHHVTVQCRRMGGGFGGKETQPALIAAAAAVIAAQGRPSRQAAARSRYRHAR